MEAAIFFDSYLPEALRLAREYAADGGYLYGYDTEYGLGGDAAIHNSSMINIARYVAVAPRNVSSSLRYLNFGV